MQTTLGQYFHNFSVNIIISANVELCGAGWITALDTLKALLAMGALGGVGVRAQARVRVPRMAKAKTKTTHACLKPSPLTITWSSPTKNDHKTLYIQKADSVF